MIDRLLDTALAPEAAPGPRPRSARARFRARTPRSGSRPSHGLPGDKRLLVTERARWRRSRPSPRSGTRRCAGSSWRTGAGSAPTPSPGPTARVSSPWNAPRCAPGRRHRREARPASPGTIVREEMVRARCGSGRTARSSSSIWRCPATWIHVCATHERLPPRPRRAGGNRRESLAPAEPRSPIGDDRRGGNGALPPLHRSLAVVPTVTAFEPRGDDRQGRAGAAPSALPRGGPSVAGGPGAPASCRSCSTAPPRASRARREGPEGIARIDAVRDLCGSTRRIPMRIGTRGSALALVQGTWFGPAPRRAREHHLDVIETSGDRNRSRRSAASAEGYLHPRIEGPPTRRCRSGRPSLKISHRVGRRDSDRRAPHARGRPRRWITRDARGSRVSEARRSRGDLVAPPAGAAPRAAAGAGGARSRGNVPTRIARLEEGGCRSVVVAAAGLLRLRLI